jgi:hypothetical protein
VLGRPLDHVQVELSKHAVAADMAADYLADLAKQAHIPVVADCFRVACGSHQEFSGQTVANWLSEFNKYRAARPICYRKGFVRTEGGWLMYRHASYWRLLTQEIPERVLATMNRTESKPLDIDAYAKFVAKLSDGQFAAFLSPRAVVTEFDPSPIARAGEFLRFWNTLSDAQRVGATKHGLLLSEMAVGSFRQLERALFQFLWTAPPPEEQFLKILLPGHKSDEPLRFFMDTRDYPEGPAREGAYGGPLPKGQIGVLARMGVGTSGEEMLHVGFIFGRKAD